jgi:hypothetical protein
VARSGVIYGSTGTFKTTAVAHFAHWIAETTGKATLLFSTDGGGWEPCQEEVLAGMIRPYKCDSNYIPLPIIRRVSQGYWPENPDEESIEQVNFIPVNWQEIGGIAVEGISSISRMLMRHAADKNLKMGQEGTSSFSQPIRVMGQLVNETFSQNSKGHYGGVQNQVLSLINNFTALPVSYVLFTGHEKKIDEPGVGKQFGLDVPGKAIDSAIPPMIGDFIHAQDYKVVEKVKVADSGVESGFREEETIRIRCRYYFVKHPDPDTGIIFDAKPRVTHSKVMELEKHFPGGFFVPTPEHGFDDYLRTVDKLAQDAAQSDSLRNWRERMDAKLRPRPQAAATTTTTK